MSKMIENRMVADGATPDEYNRPDGRPEDDEQECPECGDWCCNMREIDDLLEDCSDHIETGDLRGWIKEERRELRTRLLKTAKALLELRKGLVGLLDNSMEVGK